MSVAQILKQKGRDVVTAAPSDTVKVVAEMLAHRKIGAVVIMAEQGRVDGIVSERDIVRVIAEKGPDALRHAVGDIMTRNVKFCAEDDSEAELMSLMTQHRIRHLPVVTNGRLGGMISIGDVVKFRIEAIERDAADMKAYIAGAA